ncbi:RNA pseudouridylate synthase domain-containing protein 3 isoform X2 [Heterocephalus glaber]|nr:RNA pseudouridylate synthase domain-containing protein 3 isoform X2 [Heterocephalus glaber]
MGSLVVRRGVTRGWWLALGARARPEDAGFGIEAAFSGGSRAGRATWGLRVLTPAFPCGAEPWVRRLQSGPVEPRSPESTAPPEGVGGGQRGFPDAGPSVSGRQPQPGGGRKELAHVLRAAVVERRGPLVTLNKPQGLPVTGKPGEVTLLSVLPELSQSLGLRQQELQVVRAPGKESSGLVLLSSCPQTASRLQKFFIHSRRAHRPTATYWAVTNGIPPASEGQICAALTLQHISGVNVVVPVKSPSRRDILEGVKRTLSHFRVMATGSECALIQLQPLTAFSSQLQVHMMLQLCPVLGDHTYSACVGSVLGQRFLLPAESTKPQRQ